MVRKNTITFANGNRAVLVAPPNETSVEAILDALEIVSPRAVILLFGGAAGLDERRKTKLATLFTDGIAIVAAELGALIIDGGTQSGVMKIMGEAVARSGHTVQLLGIAPKGKITYPEISGATSSSDRAPLQANHSHFVLVDSNEWGGETTKMLELSRAFNAPIVAILVNGGAIAADEALQTVRNGWPLLVIEGSGRFADELSFAVRDFQSANSTQATEITRSGCVKLFSINKPAVELKRQLQQILCAG